jgi:hypothetical protein
MNLNRNPTLQELRDLIAPCDDAAGVHILWVKQSGDVEIATVPRGSSLGDFRRDHPEMRLCCEPFQPGNEYVGPEAARDDEWVAELLDRLTTQWDYTSGKAEVAYVGGF